MVFFLQKMAFGGLVSLSDLTDFLIRHSTVIPPYWVNFAHQLLLSTPIHFAMGQADGTDKGFATAHLFLTCSVESV